MILPGIIFFSIFCYGPMYGLLLSFKDYKFNLGIWGSPWVGMDNFQKMFDDSDFWNAFNNTIIISLGKLLFGFPFPIILAILLNELRKKYFMKFMQSVMYLPYFLSWVILASVLLNLFSTTNGTLPKMLDAWFGINMPQIMGNADYFRPLVFISQIWKTMGWDTIIYLAAIAGISPQLHEAAVIDGANRFQRIIHIVLPSLGFLIGVLFVLNVGGVMNAGFDQIFNLYDPGVYSVGDILDTYIYRVGIASININIEYGVVVGLIKSVLNLLLLVAANSALRFFRKDSIF